MTPQPGVVPQQAPPRIKGRTVLVNTGQCRLYHVMDLDGADPRLESIHQEAQSGCAMPVVIGNYWIQANAATHRIFSLDIRDLTNVRVVSTVTLDEHQRPHWLATDGSRIVVVNEPAPAAERRQQRPLGEHLGQDVIGEQDGCSANVAPP